MNNSDEVSNSLQKTSPQEAVELFIATFKENVRDNKT